jgi:hypothetical protein
VKADFALLYPPYSSVREVALDMEMKAVYTLKLGSVVGMV